MLEKGVVGFNDDSYFVLGIIEKNVFDRVDLSDSL